jgi:hypothetical protein
MAIQDYLDSTLFKWNVDSQGNKIVKIITNEIKKINSYTTVLNQVPDKFEKVTITGMYEIDINKEIKNITEFKVDYLYGFVYFHPNLDGTSITVTRYGGRGIWLLPSSRIWYELNNDKTDVIRTLEDVVDALAGKGEYSSTTEYFPNNVVSFGGGSYINIKQSTGISPSNINFWQQIATPGLSLIYKGIYDSGVIYNKQDFVSYADSFYFCKTNGTTNIIPTNTSNWEILVFPRTTVITLKNNTTLVSASSFVNIGIPEFSATTDDLTVIQNTTQIWEGIDYIVSGTQINKIDGTWEAGTTFYFKIMKNYIKSFFYTDGSLIQEGSINDSQLAGSIKIGSLNNLATNNKSNLVNAINSSRINVGTVEPDDTVFWIDTTIE